MSIQTLDTPKVLPSRTIAKYRINHLSLSICPLAADGVTELGHVVINLKEADIDALADLLAELKTQAESHIDDLES